jgi:hypothetical protein
LMRKTYRSCPPILAGSCRRVLTSSMHAMHPGARPRRKSARAANGASRAKRNVARHALQSRISAQGDHLGKGCFGRRLQADVALEKLVRAAGDTHGSGERAFQDGQVCPANRAPSLAHTATHTHLASVAYGPFPGTSKKLRPTSMGDAVSCVADTHTHTYIHTCTQHMSQNTTRVCACACAGARGGRKAGAAAVRSPARRLPR